jgi:hypothetical protein
MFLGSVLANAFTVSLPLQTTNPAFIKEIKLQFIILSEAFVWKVEGKRF